MQTTADGSVATQAVTTDSTPTTAVGGPGFGVSVALAAVLGAALLVGRRS
ncbi:PGF-CTERM sorting domain-containing protein [Haloarculaceae archaeon H-GB2-1]|nr:PGF-CTERM sorting domain-containing protein [Haloarculaceae archaeon H-GB11]MEA5408232.1 PGF-CTERM sorting domain-containing protein [Haloarculaceae archaeon H-GB2-1]